MDEDVVVGLLPSFLRESYKRVQPSGDTSALDSILWCFTFISKTYALILLSDYYAHQISSRKVNEFVKLNLFKPNVSTWDKLTLLILEQYESHGLIPFVEEIKEVYPEIQGPNAIKGKPLNQGYFDESGRFVDSSQKLSLMSLLTNFRNRKSHDSLSDSKEIEDSFIYYKQYLDLLLQKSSWICNYSFNVESKICDVGNVWHEDSLFLKSESGKYLNLTPFFVLEKDISGSDKVPDDILLFESFSKTRLCFNAPSGTFHAKIPFKDFKLLRERKALLENTNDEVSDLPEVLEFLQKINENQCSSDSVRLLQFKEFSDLRLYKSGLDSFIYSSAKILLIEGKKGYGKTNYAKYLNNIYLERGIPSVYIRANSSTSCINEFLGEALQLSSVEAFYNVSGT